MSRKDEKLAEERQALRTLVGDCRDLRADYVD